MCEKNSEILTAQIVRYLRLKWKKTRFLAHWWARLFDIEPS